MSPSLPDVLKRPKEPAPDPGTMYQCIGSHVSKVGTFQEGQRRLGSHPAVQAAPRYWAAADLDGEELAERRRLLMLGGDPTAGTAPDARFTFAGEIPPERQFRTTKAVVVPAGVAAIGPVMLPPGLLVDSKVPHIAVLMKHFPGSFAPVKPSVEA